jgi:hypothetical protein
VQEVAPSRPLRTAREMEQAREESRDEKHEV